jgi:hypothetical protein
LPVGWPTATRNVASWDNAHQKGKAETRSWVSAFPQKAVER